jgi:hypothetical protein
MGAMLLLHRYIERRDIEAAWGDVQAGATFERARKNLLRLEEDAYHPKNWRPSILALSGRAWDRVHLAAMAHWLTGGRGLLTLAQVVPGLVGAHLQRRQKQEESLRAFIRDTELQAFPAVLVAESIPAGIEALVQCYGIGAFRPNVVLLGWSTDPARAADFCGTLRTVAGLERSTVLVRSALDDDADAWVPPEGPIDVWWRGQANGHLMLLLAHLLAENDAWRGRTIRLLRTIGDEAGREDATTHLEQLIRDARIDAIPVVLVTENFLGTIHDVSADSACTFFGFEPPEQGADDEFHDRMNRLMEGLGTTIVVWSAGDVALEA